VNESNILNFRKAPYQISKMWSSVDSWHVLSSSIDAR